jgi:hypothetical protein
MEMQLTILLCICKSYGNKVHAMFDPFLLYAFTNLNYIIILYDVDAYSIAPFSRHQLVSFL